MGAPGWDFKDTGRVFARFLWPCPLEAGPDPFRGPLITARQNESDENLAWAFEGPFRGANTDTLSTTVPGQLYRRAALVPHEAGKPNAVKR